MSIHEEIRFGVFNVMRGRYKTEDMEIALTKQSFGVFVAGKIIAEWLGEGDWAFWFYNK